VSENEGLSRIQLAKGQRRKNTMEIDWKCTVQIPIEFFAIYYPFFYLFMKFSSSFVIHIRSPFMALSNVDECR
jgi:hypothetical protein